MKRSYYLFLALCLCSADLSAQEKKDADNDRTLSADSLITKDAKLDSLYQSLPEVMITGERPVVKAEQGKLVYDLPRIISEMPVDNAYEAIKELPGVTEMNGVIQLAGQGTTVILNGKVTTLSTEQLYALLKSIPADRIEKIPYLSLVRPKGTFYLFPGVEKTGLDDKQFCKELLERAHVLVSAGSPFGKTGANHFRIACTVGIDQLKQAFDRMEKLEF